jgi:hypothetical protein
MAPPRVTAPGSVVVTAFREQARYGRVKFARAPVAKKPVAFPARPAHAARILALAHHLEKAISSQLLKGPTDAARRIGITDARVTQVLTLLYLAPDIQEDVLLLESSDGREPFTESKLRKIARVRDWTEQRALYARLRPGFARGTAE